MSLPTPRPRRAASLLLRLGLLVAFVIPFASARAQSTSTIPSEDFGWQHAIPAGPYSVVNTGTGTLVTSIPIVKLTGPGGTVLDFTLYHASTGTGNSTVGQAARGWRHTYDEWITANNNPNLSTFAQRSTAARGTAEWTRSSSTVPYVRKPGVRDDLTPDPNGFYFTVRGKDQSVSNYSYRRLSGYCLSSITDTHNNQISVSYDASGRVSTVTDVAGRTLTLGYKDSYSLSYVILTAGTLTRRWDFTTDVNSCLTRIDFPAPVANGTRPAIVITPDGAGRILDLYDRNNNHWHYDYYTPAGGPTQVWKVTDPYSGLPVTFSTTYGAGTSTTTVTDQLGRIARHDYTANATMASTTTYLINKVTDPKVTADSAAFFETWSWNTADGTLTSMVDRRAKTWQFTWDSNNYGDMLTQKDPLLNTTQHLYSAQHKVIRTIDPAGHRTLASYDPTSFDLTQQVTDPKTDPNDGTYSNPTGLAVTKNYSYYANGDPSTVQVLPDPATTYTNYDGYGNARTVTDPLGYPFTATFDALNQKLSSTEPAPGGTTSCGYDLLGRLTSVTHPDTKVLSYGFDAADNRTSVTDENGHISYFDPDSLNRVWRIRQNTTSTTTLTTTFAFNNAGDKTGATNPRNYSTAYSYDERHKLIKVTYPDNTARTFHYDGNGNRDKRWDGANALTTYTYDDANRLTLSSYPSGATISNHYLADGLRDSMTDPTGTSTWAYDGAHLPTSAYFPLAGISVTYTYDSKGRKATMAVGGGTWTYSYDSDDHPKTISESFGFSPAVTFNYNGNGTVANKLLGNNTRTYYTYDNRNRTTNLSHRYFNGSTETEQEAVGYTYDNAGNPLTYSDNQSTAAQSWSTSYQFDWANRLTSEIQTGSAGATFNNQYVYDGNGNRASVTRNGVASTYTVDNTDKFTSGDGLTFTNYDNNGNPSYVWSGGLLQQNIVYDYENQVTQITYNGGAVNSFLYNGDNLRVRKTDSQGTTNMLYDGTNLICETNTSGGIVAWYTPGVDFRRSGVPYAYRENAIGSTMQVTNNLGTVVDRFQYDAYGVTYTLQQSMFTPHKFAGKHGYYADGDSGMELLGHRYYLPSLGRFLTQDPLGHEAGLNLYQYASQNPLVNVDPDGQDAVRHQPEDEIKEQFRPKGWFETLGSYVGLGKAGYNIDHITEIVSNRWHEMAKAGADAMDHALAATIGTPGGDKGASGAGRSSGPEQISKDMLANSRVIARGKNIREVDELVAQFGGRAKGWVKKSSPIFEHNGRMAEYHWYEHHGIGRVLQKISYK